MEESGYYLTQLESAVHFLLHIKPSQIKLSDDEFDLYMSGKHPSQIDSVESKNNNTFDNLTVDDALKYLTEGVDMSKYLFLDNNVEDLKISSVPQLLKSYKQLVIQHESLKNLLTHSQKPFSIDSSQILSRLDIAKSSDRLGLSADENDAYEFYNAPKPVNQRANKEI